MSDSRKLSLKKAICALENPFPKDDLISCYSDFLKHREFLLYYQFNPAVLENLLEICNDLWTTEKRISRLSLLENIKKYLHCKERRIINDAFQYHTKPSTQLALNIKKQLFNIFKKVYEQSEYMSALQRDTAKTLVNNMLMNIAFSPEEENWLIEHISLSNHILNRVLRYPAKSTIISEWAVGNFENDIYRNRRAELLSWLIDKTPNFVIQRQILIDDFNYFNIVDKKAIKLYKDELEANAAVGREFSEFLPKLESENTNIYGDPFYGNDSVDLTIPELKLTRRFYDRSSYSNDTRDKPLPSFEMMHHNFHSNIDVIHSITMIWGIAYSRLKNEIKTKLIKNYLREETYNSILKVATKNKNISLLKWLMEQQ